MWESLCGKASKHGLAALLAINLTMQPAIALALDTESITAAIRQGQPPEELKDVVLSPGEPLPGLSSRAAIVMDAATGLVIYERAAEKRMYPASTTKIMTAIIALETGDLDEVVKVSHNAANTEGSTLWLREGDKRTLRELLYGMMLVSGNDATVAVAEHIAGSVPAFAKMMTERAHELGAENTNFMNSSGLPDDRHYTTAHDLAILTAHAYTLPEFEEIVSTKEKSYPWVDDPSHLLRNENQMLWFYEGGNGVKTGYTDVAGRCLVSGAKRHGLQLITVVLDSLYMWNDSIALLDYGFSQVSIVPVVEAGEIVTTVDVSGGTKGSLPLKTAEAVSLAQLKHEDMKFEKKLKLPPVVKAPIKEGDRVGRLVVYHDGLEVAATDLIATQSIEHKSFFARLYEWLKSLWKGFF